MTLDEFIDSIEGFELFGISQQILAIAWFMDRQEKRPNYTEAQIIDRFDRVRLPRPANFGSVFAELCQNNLLLRSPSGNCCLARTTLSKLYATYSKRPTTIAVQNLLAELPAKLTQEHDRAYLDEALICFKHGAFRAAIVMAWNLAFDHVCTVVHGTYLSKFNLQLPTSYPKARIASVSTKDDFAELKDYEVIQVCRSAGIISVSVHKLLKEKLDRRNIAAHPNGVCINQHTTEEFILDLVNNVVLALK